MSDLYLVEAVSHWDYENVMWYSSENEDEVTDDLRHAKRYSKEAAEAIRDEENKNDSKYELPTVRIWLEQDVLAEKLGKLCVVVDPLDELYEDPEEDEEENDDDDSDDDSDESEDDSDESEDEEGYW